MNQTLTVQDNKGKVITDEWIIDNGTTHHMIGNHKLFHDYKLTTNNERVSVANGTGVPIVGRGSVSLMQKYFAHDVLLVHYLSLNLLSIVKITKELMCADFF